MAGRRSFTTVDSKPESPRLPDLTARRLRRRKIEMDEGSRHGTTRQDGFDALGASDRNAFLGFGKPREVIRREFAHRERSPRTGPGRIVVRLCYYAVMRTTLDIS